jgi:hypothetical protein
MAIHHPVFTLERGRRMKSLMNIKKLRAAPKSKYLLPPLSF